MESGCSEDQDHLAAKPLLLTVYVDVLGHQRWSGHLKVGSTVAIGKVFEVVRMLVSLGTNKGRYILEARTAQVLSQCRKSGARDSKWWR